MTAPAPVGHNMPPPIEAFSMALDDVYSTAKDYLDGKPIATQAEADNVGVIMATARRIKKDADAARAEEKRPHLEAGRAVDEAWKPLDTRADNIIKAAQKPLTAFLEAEEAKRRAEAEDKLVEALRLQTEALKARQGSEGNLSALEDAEALQKAADAAGKAARRADKERPNVAGMDRALGLRSRQVADVTDRRALLEHILRHDPEPLAAWLDEYARKALPSQLPGVTIRTERKAA